MKKIYFILFLFIIPSLNLSCQDIKIENEKIKVGVNYTVTMYDTIKYKLIVSEWESYLNSGKISYYMPNSLSFWIKSKNFPMPNTFMFAIGKDKNEIINIKKNQVSIIALYPIRKDTYALKTMFCYYKDSTKVLMIDNIYTNYAVFRDSTIKFMSSPQWYAQKWEKKTINNITYLYPNGYKFNDIKAIQLDSFNKEMSKIFNTEPLKFKYFVCENNEQVYEVLVQQE